MCHLIFFSCQNSIASAKSSIQGSSSSTSSEEDEEENDDVDDQRVENLNFDHHLESEEILVEPEDKESDDVDSLSDSTNTSVSSDKSQCSQHSQALNTYKSDEDSVELTYQNSQQEREEVDLKLKRMIEREVGVAKDEEEEEEQEDSDFDDIEYVNTIAMSGSHSDNSSVGAEDLESIMDKVERSNDDEGTTFCEVRMLL